MTRRDQLHRLLGVTLLGVIFARGLRFARYELFTGFANWDDEGYVLLSVQQFLERGGLYHETFSSYGPAFYLYRALLATLGLPLTHDGTRWWTLVEWGGAGLLAAALVFRLTRQRWLAALTLAQVIAGVTTLGVEPGHPQGVLLVALFGLLWIATRAPDRAATWGWLGLGLGLLLTVKLNVGAFATVAVVLVVLAHRAAPRALQAVAAAAALALPVVLLHRHLGRGWCQELLWLELAATWALLLGLRHGARPRDLAWRRHAGWCLAGLLAAAGVALGFALVTGSSVVDLVDGLLRFPAAQTGVLIVAPTFPAFAGWLAAASLALALVSERLGPRRLGCLTALRILVAGGVIWNTLGDPHGQLAWAVPGAWLLVAPAPGRDHPGAPRALLAGLAVVHTLVIYPVAGGQSQIAAALSAPLAALLLDDASRVLLQHRRLRPAVPAGYLVCLAIVVTPLVQIPARAAHDAAWPLRLPGAESLRVPLLEAASLRWAATNLTAHCDTFVSYPGLGSMHAWSGRPPPTGWNVTTWMIIFSPARQQTLVEAYDAAPRVMALRGDPRFWLRGRDVSTAPLVRYVDESLAPWRSCGELTLKVRPGRDALDEFLLHGEQAVPSPERGLAFPWTTLGLESGPLSIELRFATDGAVVLAGLLDGAPGRRPRAAHPLAYVGTDGTLRAQLRTGAPDPLQSATRVDDGRWHHLALVGDGASEVLYLDGAAVARGRAGAIPRLAAGLLGSGWAAPAGWSQAPARLADARLHRRALNPAEVAARAARQ